MLKVTQLLRNNHDLNPGCIRVLQRNRTNRMWIYVCVYIIYTYREIFVIRI